MAPLVGLALGRWATRPALRPLSVVTEAASDIARGRLDRRIDPGDDPDLAPVARYFNQTAAMLQERVQRDARFAADVSHELRNPLTTIVNAADLLAARRHQLPADVAEVVTVLRAEVGRFERMVVDLLEISRSDAGARDLLLQDVQPAELVRHSLPARLHDRIIVVPPADNAVVSTDKRRLERIITNLVDNAEKHGGGLSGVTVEIRDSELRILVDDSGPGIDPGERRRVFEPFARGPGAGKTDGAGLGLPLVQRHVALLGGRVEVEDIHGGGARFAVSLPTGGPP